MKVAPIQRAMKVAPIQRAMKVAPIQRAMKVAPIQRAMSFARIYKYDEFRASDYARGRDVVVDGEPPVTTSRRWTHMAHVTDRRLDLRYLCDFTIPS